MLTGYQKSKAVALILSRISPEAYKMLPSDMLEQLIGQCVDADFDYMISQKVSRPDGSDGEYYYNKDNAFHYIYTALFKKNGFTAEYEDELFALVDDYMDFNRSYLELNGLRYHEDERFSPRGLAW